MNENDIVRARRLPDGTLVQTLPDGTTRPFSDDGTDWQRLAEMTEEEIEANALSDPDNPPLTDAELRSFRRVVDVRGIRQRQHLTQEQFSHRYRIPLGTLRDWEQRAHVPDGAAKTLLRVIDKYPEIVLDVLADEFGGSTIEDAPNEDPTAPSGLSGAGSAHKRP